MTSIRNYSIADETLCRPDVFVENFITIQDRMLALLNETSRQSTDRISMLIDHLKSMAYLPKELLVEFSTLRCRMKHFDIIISPNLHKELVKLVVKISTLFNDNPNLSPFFHPISFIPKKHFFGDLITIQCKNMRLSVPVKNLRVCIKLDDKNKPCINIHTLESIAKDATDENLIGFVMRLIGETKMSQLGATNIIRYKYVVPTQLGGSVRSIENNLKKYERYFKHVEYCSYCHYGDDQLPLKMYRCCWKQYCDDKCHSLGH